MNKNTIRQSILETLREEFESFRDSSKKTRNAGNDMESKSEGKYDTRSIEENYLADGLAKQAQAVAKAAEAYEKLVFVDFAKDQPIEIGALVQLEFAKETAWFFLGPAGGGIEIFCEEVPITVLTPESPLGSQLLDLKVGGSTKSPKARVRAIQ